MQKYLLVILIFFLNYFGFAQVPSISSFNPVSAGPLSTVTIEGNGFDDMAINNIVYFGAVRATIISGNSSSLIVTVPVGATYFPVSVTTNKLTAYSNTPFMPV